MKTDNINLSAGRLAEIINDASIDRIIALDKKGNITVWNNSCADLTSKHRSEVIGKNFYDVFGECRDNKYIVKGIEDALKGFRAFVSSEKGSCMGDFHDSHFIPLKDEQGNVEGVLCLMHDVAQKVKAENELKALNKALVRKNKELKEKNEEILAFSQVTGHDLKEPLRKIYSFIEIILSKEADRLSETGKSYFKRVQASVQRMGMLTDDLLHFSQLGINNTDNLVTLDLNEVLGTAKSDLKNAIEEKAAVISSGTLPVIKGYKAPVTEMFRRILSNALKFQDGGQQPVIAITSSMLKGNDIDLNDVVASRDYYRVSFADNGIGFEQRYAERIFGIFQRLHNKDTYPGSGMGLALCRKIMQLHEGFITAESVPGKGSTFHCCFPVK